MEARGLAIEREAAAPLEVPSEALGFGRFADVDIRHGRGVGS